MNPSKTLRSPFVRSVCGELVYCDRICVHCGHPPCALCSTAFCDVVECILGYNPSTATEEEADAAFDSDARLCGDDGCAYEIPGDPVFYRADGSVYGTVALRM